MKEALTYMFKDNKFGQKFLICYLIAIIPSFILQFNLEKISQLSLVLVLLIYFLWIFWYYLLGAYFCTCIKTISIQKSDYVLPFFKFAKVVRLSLKYFIASITLAILLLLSFILYGLITYFIVSSAFSTSNLMLIILSIVIAILLFLPVVNFLYKIPALYYVFALNENITDFINLFKVSKLIKQNLKRYIKSIFIMLWSALLMSITYFVGFIFLSLLLPTLAAWSFNPKALYIIIPSLLVWLITIYFLFVNAYIIGKCLEYKE